MGTSVCLRKLPRFLLPLATVGVIAACGGTGNFNSPAVNKAAVALPPKVIQTTPAKTIPIATGVATNLGVQARFNQDMNALSINTSSFKMACPSGVPMTGTMTVSYDSASRLAMLRHTSNFPSNTTCVATITTGARNTSNAPLASDYVWSFTTGNTTDTAPPTVVTTSPPDTATAVCVTKSVNITFSEPMDASSINATTLYVTDPVNVAISGTVAYDISSKSATFTVTGPAGFAASTLYTVHVTTGAQDLAGNAIGMPQTLSFTTGTQSCTPMVSANLGSIATYGTFGGGAGTTNSGIHTVVNGDLGTTAACTLFTGFHNDANVYTETPLNIGAVTGDIFCAPPAPGTTDTLAFATQAAADARTAYNDLAAIPLGILTNPELGGITLPPGVYKSSAADFRITMGDLTLDAAGDPDAAWAFQVPAALTMGLPATPRSVMLINGARAKNVYWQVGSFARIEDGSSMAGTIIAYSGVTISTVGQSAQTTLNGRAIGLNASVTMVNTTITTP